MPTYVYRCDACEKQFEQVQSFRDDPLTICPCGKEGRVRRVIQPAGIVFKGSGWYITDSRKAEPAAKSDSATSETPAADGKAADGKAAENKPAETTPAANSPAAPSETKAASAPAAAAE